MDRTEIIGAESQPAESAIKFGETRVPGQKRIAPEASIAPGGTEEKPLIANVCKINCLTINRLFGLILRI
jgi:hypothetical protein